MRLNQHFRRRNRQAGAVLFAVCVFFALTDFPRANMAVEPVASRTAASATDLQDRHHGAFSLTVGRGVRITLGNRTTGRITVNGWDRDVIEARALSERGKEVVIGRTSVDSAIQRVFLKADYADVNQPAAPTSEVGDPPGASDGGNLKVHLEVNVPRYAEIDLIQVWRSDVQITDVETAITVSGDKSSIILKRPGSAEVHTRSGHVEIEDAGGPVEVATTSGAVRINSVKGPVRVVSITGPIEIKCARNRIDVANTQAPIELINIDGDVEAIATNSSVRFTGRLREEGRYYLKSLSGRVEMTLPANSPGFDAALTSYQGLVESDFTLNRKQTAGDSAHNRRMVGRFGNGGSHVTLDSFDGLVRLTKVDPASLPGCKSR